jgi:hypothetical protein
VFDFVVVCWLEFIPLNWLRIEVLHFCVNFGMVSFACMVQSGGVPGACLAAGLSCQ